MRELKIKLGRKKTRGRYAHIYKPKGLDELYARKNLCLKVIREETYRRGNPDLRWGATSLKQATIMQNLYAQKGLAPRVYDIVKVGKDIAQVTDYLKGKLEEVDLPEDSNFIYHKPDFRYHRNNYIDGKLVDFEDIYFKDFEKYREKIRKKIVMGKATDTRFPVGYQSLEYQGGQRDTATRLKKYDIRNLQNKTVLDMGCSLGAFCRYAIDKGAKRVIGMDLPPIIKYSEMMAYLDGYFNIDFYGRDLSKITREEIKEITGLNHFDVIFYFAVSRYLGMPDWLKNCDTLYYEGHGTSEQRKREFYVKEMKTGRILRRFFWDN